MPFALLLIGLVMVMAALNNRQKELGDLWASELSGDGSFLNVLFVMFILGAAGAITGLKPLAVAFMGLVLLVMVLSNSGASDSLSIVADLRKQLLGGGTPVPAAATQGLSQ